MVWRIHLQVESATWRLRDGLLRVGYAQQKASKSSPTSLGDRPCLFPILFYAILSRLISVKMPRVSLKSQVSMELTK